MTSANRLQCAIDEIDDELARYIGSKAFCQSAMRDHVRHAPKQRGGIRRWLWERKYTKLAAARGVVALRIERLWSERHMLAASLDDMRPESQPVTGSLGTEPGCRLYGREYALAALTAPRTNHVRSPRVLKLRRGASPRGW